MTSPWQIIKDLEEHNLRTNKEQIIDANRNNTEFLEGCRLALDPMITFGLKQIPEKKNEDGPGLDWDSFTLAITGFTTRNVTGNTARYMIENMMNAATQEQWNYWYRRILIKDLRCGVSEKTINKVVKGAIPVFECQLSHDSANHESKVCGKKMLEVKLDGVRVLTVVYPDGRVDQFSRNGKELLNFGHIRDQFAAVSSGLTQPTVFDGEIMSSSFQDLMKQVHRKENVEAGDAVLHLFDIIPLDKFQAGKFEVKQKERTAWLSQWYLDNQNKLPNVQVLDHAVVDLDTDEGRKLFAMYNKSAVENGYEGIMIKDLNAPYECKRSAAWLKSKPFIEVSLGVVNVEEGTGRNVGRLGAFVCAGNDDGKHIKVNVGSGFSDSDRDSFWASHVELDNIIGQVVEVRADAVTQNQDGSYSLRFPRFLRFRGFAPGEKL
jgi:DNA ligase-1